MDYHIEISKKHGWEVIANFIHEYDRDVCLDAFKKQWKNDTFRGTEDEERRK